MYYYDTNTNHSGLMVMMFVMIVMGVMIVIIVVMIIWQCGKRNMERTFQMVFRMVSPGENHSGGNQAHLSHQCQDMVPFL